VSRFGYLLLGNVERLRTALAEILKD